MQKVLHADIIELYNTIYIVIVLLFDMARTKERQEAIKLRKQGKTYSEIKKKLGLPKSTLSDWLSKYPLTKEQIKEIERSSNRNREAGIEKCSITKQKKREARLDSIYKEEVDRLLPLSEKELYLIGLFLYWGEGLKNIKGSLSLSNTDPSVVKFYLYWLIKSFNIPLEKIRIAVHLYADMDTETSLNFWSKTLRIPRKQFFRPYIKKSKRSEITQKGFGHGTCNVILANVRLKEKVIMGIKAISDRYTDLALLF